MMPPKLAVSIALSVLLVGATALLNGCSLAKATPREQSSSHTASVLSTNTVILPAETDADYWGFPSHLAPIWNPTTNEVSEALCQLPNYLQRSHTLFQLEQLPQTICQALGVTSEG